MCSEVCCIMKSFLLSLSERKRVMSSSYCCFTPARFTVKSIFVMRSKIYNHASVDRLPIIQFALSRVCLWMLIMALRVNLVCLMWVRSHYCYAAYAFKVVIFKYLLVRRGHTRLLLLHQCRLLTGSQWGFGFSWWSLQHTVQTFDPASCRCCAHEGESWAGPRHQMSWSLIGPQSKLRLKQFVDPPREAWWQF